MFIVNEIFILIISILSLIFIKQIPNLEYLSLINLGFIIIIAFFTGRLFKKIGLPTITGYMFAGLIVSPFSFSLTPEKYIEQYKLIDLFAITFIGMQAGSEMNLRVLKKDYKNIFTITFLIILITFIGIFLILFFTGNKLFNIKSEQLKYLYAIILIFGIAKSPVTTIAIINETKIRNPFTYLILGITIIKDILLIIIFTIVISIIEISLSSVQAFSIITILPILTELFGSMIMGWFIALLIVLYLKYIKFNSQLLIITFAFLISFSETFIHINPLIVGMSIGFFIENYSEHSKYFMKSLNSLSPIIYILFFPLASAVLNIRIIGQVILPVIIILIFRSVFIFLSFQIGNKLSRIDNFTKKHGWMGLINQSGITLALAIIVSNTFSMYNMNELGEYIKTFAIASIIITDFYGPPLFKFAVRKSSKYFE